MDLEKLLQEFEGIVYNDMQDYSQFTIDFIDDSIVDVPEDKEDLECYIDALAYRVDNVLNIIKESLDKDLFEELLKRLVEL